MKNNLPLITRNLLLCIMIPVFLSGCEERFVSSSLTGQWRLTAYEDEETGEVWLEPDHIARSIEINFSDNGIKGDFEGETVTNTIRGRYKINNTSEVSFTDIDGTLKGEPEWGDRFWKSMESASSFSVSGKSMKVYYEDGKKKMIFEWIGVGL